MAVGRCDSGARRVGDTATASKAAAIHEVVVGERGLHGSLIVRGAATQPQSPSEVHALSRLTAEEEDGERRARTRSSDLANGGFPAGSKKPP